MQSRYFYKGAIASGIILCPIEYGVAVAIVVSGFLISILFRVLITAIILYPFFQLISHARYEDGVGEVRLFVWSVCGQFGMSMVRIFPF